MNMKLIGGILLIAGTCIGGGMLGLPIATSKSGFFHSTLLFIACWLLMTFTALLTLEVNLSFPPRSNIFSMAKATLGRSGEILCWTAYLLFLYALVAAYIAGGQDILHRLLLFLHIDIPLWVCSIIFVTLFGAVVSAGIKHVDLFNRFLMLAKFMTIFALIMLIAAHVDIHNYVAGEAKFLLPALTVVITSFGFSIIVPSLRNYFADDTRQLRIVIIVGSLLPLLCYVAWNAVIFGLVPLAGEFGLARLMNAEQPISALLMSINYYLPTEAISWLSHVFMSICLLTAFSCVSLGLADYLGDGLRLRHLPTEKQKWRAMLIMLLTFMPPLLIVIFYPQAFILLLSVAGLLCVLLQALMPALMAWVNRYHHKRETSYVVYGGRVTLVMAMLMSVGIILITTYQMFTV
jgi:tyrosine-specific transport protein